MPERQTAVVVGSILATSILWAEALGMITMSGDLGNGVGPAIAGAILGGGITSWMFVGERPQFRIRGVSSGPRPLLQKLLHPVGTLIRRAIADEKEKATLLDPKE